MSAVRRHPVRGLFAGLFAGLGVALLLVVTSQIALGTLTPLVIVGVGIVVGLVWSQFGPVRRRRATSRTSPPEHPTAVAEPVGAPGATTADVPVAEVPVVDGWEATHAAPTDGLVTYAGSDEGGAPNGRLEPGLPVQVAEQAGAWARIVCSNGWSAWVDASLLVGPESVASVDAEVERSEPPGSDGPDAETTGDS